MSDKLKMSAYKKELIYKMYYLFQKIEEYEYKKAPTSIIVNIDGPSPQIFWMGDIAVIFFAGISPGYKLAVSTYENDYSKRYTKVLKVINMFKTLIGALDIPNAFISGYEELSDELDNLLSMSTEEFILYLKFI